MSSLVSKDQGVYDPSLRFAFTNITDEDLTSAWDGQPITIKAHQTVELPHHLADKLTDELVNKIMIGEVKLNESEYYKKNPNAAPNTYRAPSQLGVPAARRVLEEQIVRKMDVDEESPEIQLERIKIREELMRDLNPEKVEQVAIPTSAEEFADVTAPKAEAPKKPLKVKTIK